MSTVRAWYVLVAVLLLAGCSRADGSSAATPDPIPATATSSDGVAGHAFGQTVDADHSFIEATVFAYQQPVGVGAPAPNPGDYSWAAVDVRTCASTAIIFNASVSSLHWMLVYADNTEVESARVSYPQFPDPRYPVTQRTLKPGECVRGWIVFPVPDGARPTLVRYAPYGATPVDWTVAPTG